MKKFLKKYGILIFVFLVLISIFSFNAYKYLKNAHNLELKDYETREICSKNNLDENMKRFCDEVEKTPVYKIDFYSMFYSTFCQGYYYMTLFIFLLIVIPSINTVCKFMKNNIFKNSLLREGYRTSIFKLFISAYRSALILPILTIIAFIVCYVSTGNFDFMNAVEGNSVSWSINSLKTPVIFMSIYVFKIFVVSLIYVNISLIACRKNQSFIISTITSFLYFIAIEVFLEVVCNMLISNMIFKSDFGILFNILSIFSLFDYYGLFYSILIPVFLLIISFFVVYLLYRNKEKILIECEKNA